MNPYLTLLVFCFEQKKMDVYIRGIYQLCPALRSAYEKSNEFGARLSGDYLLELMDILILWVM
ncbi:hypothetical protein GCM10022277_24550 [Litoribacillus peritrichatus]|uniref:Uncharacterized protein n=1 Tax=Litoribacillus peritrichatus TaxID=718191 RepID=A0ABP7MS24_9GAMM